MQRTEALFNLHTGERAELPVIAIPVCEASAEQIAQDRGRIIAGGYNRRGDFAEVRLSDTLDAALGKWLYFDYYGLGRGALVRHGVSLDEIEHQVDHVRAGDTCDDCAARHTPLDRAIATVQVAMARAPDAEMSADERAAAAIVLSDATRRLSPRTLRWLIELRRLLEFGAEAEGHAR